MGAQRRFLNRKRVILTLLGLVAAIALWAAYSIVRMVKVVIPHSYAAWTVGDLLIEYLETHTNQWPRSWKDLSEARDSLVLKGRAIYCDFDKLTNMVRIDWNVKPPELAKTALANGESAVKVVTQSDGSRLEANWGPDTEPNRKVAHYLIYRMSVVATGQTKSINSPTNR